MRTAQRIRLPTIGVAVAVATVAVIYVVAGRDREEPPSPPASQQNQPAFRGNRLPEGIVGRRAPEFRLPDARGGSVDTRRLRGTPYVVTFLYTSCTDVCPLIGAELGQALRILGPASDEVAVVAVSVDPSRDTQAAARRWLARHHLPRNFHYTIGPERELRPVWRSYFAAPQPPGGKQSLHTASIWLIDAQGRWRTKFSGGAPVAPADIAHDLGLLVDEAQRQVG